MVQCAIIGCNNRSDNKKKRGRDKVSFFSLPKVVLDKGKQMRDITTERRCAWLKAISRADLVGKKLNSVRVCSRHFKKGEYINTGTMFVLHSILGKPSYHMRKNDEDWAPSLHLGHEKLKSEKSMDIQERGKRAESRKRRREEAEHETQENEIAEEISAAVFEDVNNDDHDTVIASHIKKHTMSKLL